MRKPDTISDKEWERIQREANKAEAREGGMFSKKATERREAHKKARDKKGLN